MANTLTLDIIENARWTEVDGYLTEIVRMAIVVVGDTVPTDPPPFDSIVVWATDPNLNPDLPVPGEQHPVRGELILRERRPTPLSTKLVQIELIYRRRDEGQPPPPTGSNSVIQGSTSLDQITTQNDRAEPPAQITVEHDGVTQGGEISVQVPRTQLSFTREEQSSTPGLRGLNNVGRVNLETFQGLPPGTWLCMDISFELLVPGSTVAPIVPSTWRFTYRFKFDPEGHDPAVVFIDPETGQPPPGLIEDEGFKTVPYYQAADFNLLEL